MPVREYTINPGETIKITCGATAPASGNAKLFNPFNNFENAKPNAKPNANANAKPNANASAKPNASATAKSKRLLSAALLKMGENRSAIFENLKRKWAEENPSFVSANAATLKAAIARGEAKPKPLFSNALKEHSRRQREGNPEAEAKHAAYRSKVESARAAKSASASASASSAASSAPAPAVSESSKPRKNPWANLSEEQRKNRIAKMQQGKTAKKAKPANNASAALPAAPKNAEVVAASANNIEAFSSFELNGEQYFKNGLNFVYKKTSDGGFGDYAGKYDPATKRIDTSVPEPALAEGGGRRKTRRRRS